MAATATPTPHKVWIYSRTSSKSDREDRHDNTGKISLTEQTKDARELATRLGLVVVGVSEDNQYSSRTYPSNTPAGQYDNDSDYLDYCRNRIKAKSHWLRPGLAEVMANLSQIDTIVIRDMTRLCRPYKDSGLLGYLFQQLRKHNVCLMLTGSNGAILEPNDSTVRLIQTLSMGVEDSQMEVKYAGAVSSVASKRDTGKLYRAVRCYGYKTINRVVTADPKALEVVRGIFQRFNADMAQGEIVRWAQTADTKRHWTRSNLKFVLRNIVYCGYHYNSDKQMVLAEYMQNVYTPITLSDFQQAKNRLDTKSTGSHECTTIHPLSGLLRCGYCGAGMVLTQTEGINYYRCLSVHNTNPKTIDCPSTMIRADTEPHVNMTDEVRAMRGVGALDCLRPLVVASYLRHLQQANGTDAQKAELAALDLRLAQLDKDGVDINDMKQAQEIDMPQYRDMTAKLKATKDALKIKREGVSRALAASLSLDSLDWDRVLNGGKVEKVTEQRLLRQTLASVDVFAYHLRVVWQDGSSFVIQRQTYKNQRACPRGTAEYRREVGEAVCLYVTYHYDTTSQPVITYAGTNTIVQTQGKAHKPQFRRQPLTADLAARYNAPLPIDSPDRL